LLEGLVRVIIIRLPNGIERPEPAKLDYKVGGTAMPLLGFEKDAATQQWEEGSRMNGDRKKRDLTTRKILSTGILVGVILTALFGGLALIVRALRNVDLGLNLSLKKNNHA
jgi:hypothetical protein